MLRNPDDHTDVSLIFGNVSDKDILLKKEIDDMARKHSNFHVRSSVTCNNTYSLPISGAILPPRRHLSAVLGFSAVCVVGPILVR